MSWNRTIRSAHRWLSIAFTLGFIANLAAAALGLQEIWIGLLALAPLILLMLSGLYLFALPYFGRGRSAHGAGATE